MASIIPQPDEYIRLDMAEKLQIVAFLDE